MSQSQNPAETSTDHEQPTPTAHKSGMTRRDLLRRSAVAGATVGGVSAGAIRLDHGPVQNSQAVLPAVAGVVAIGGTGWLLRDQEIIGSDSPAEGMTAEAYRSQLHNALTARKSNNQSTFLDNRNLIQNINHAAWADGKLAAIEALNDQKPESEVQAAANAAIVDYHLTVLENLLKSWNESVRELRVQVEGLTEHPDLGWGEFNAMYNPHNDPAPDVFQFPETTIELPNGDDFQLLQIDIRHDVTSSSTNGAIWSPVDLNLVGGDTSSSAYYNFGVTTDIGGYDQFTYLDYEDWSPLYEEINEEFDKVKDGISMYVSNVYSEVQSGDIDTTDLLTPRERAALTSEDEDFNQAIADLQALNIATDLEREAEVYFPGPQATAYGQLSYNGNTSLSVGTVNPDATDADGDPVYSGSFYFTYDVSQGQGTWDAYESGVDGGVVTFTSDPFPETIYSLTTAADETVQFHTDDLTEDGDHWTIDLSADLDNAITNVESVEYYSDVETTQYETIQLTDEFEIVQFSDSDGNTHESADFERSEPHTDDNYITEEEWQEQQARHEELIEKFEDAQGGGIAIPGVEDVLQGEANGLIGIAVVGFVLVSAILSALNPLS